MMFKELLNSLKYIFKYILIFYIITFFVIAIQENTPIKNEDLGFSLALIISIFIYFILLKREAKSLLGVLRIRDIRYPCKTLLLLLAISLGAFLFDLSLGDYLSKVFVTDISSDDSINIFFIIHALILAPIFEETLFRKIILLTLKTSIGKYPSLIIQATLFGFSHGALSGHVKQSILAGLSGLLFGLIYLKINNLIVPIALHMIHNLIPTILILMSIDNISTNAPIIFLPLACFIIILSLKSIYKYQEPLNL